MKIESKNQTTKIEAKESTIRDFIETYHAGGEITPKDRNCLSLLLGLAENCSGIRRRIEQTATQIFDSMAAIVYCKNEFDRFLKIGCLPAAAAAMKPVPEMVREMETLRRQLDTMINELNNIKLDIVNSSGLAEIRADYHTAAAAIQRREETLRLLEKAMYQNEKDFETCLLIAESITREIDQKKQNLPIDNQAADGTKSTDFDDLPENS